MPVCILKYKYKHIATYIIYMYVYIYIYIFICDPCSVPAQTSGPSMPNTLNKTGIRPAQQGRQTDDLNKRVFLGGSWDLATTDNWAYTPSYNWGNLYKAT